MDQKRLERIRKIKENRHQDIIVILEDIHDPHNSAAILRTCDALGIQNVWFIFEKETPYDPKKIGKATSATANKWLDFTIFTSTLQCINTLKQQGYTVMVTALAGNAQSILDHKATDKKNRGSGRKRKERRVGNRTCSRRSGNKNTNAGICPKSQRVGRDSNNTLGDNEKKTREIRIIREIREIRKQK